MPQAKYFFWTFATWEVGWGAEPPPTGPQKKFFKKKGKKRRNTQGFISFFVSGP